ncbi:MAG: hypothetical protein AUK35_09100 [Zetaproteobacteria bacterium CG2_30_46_52]|nr:MAG: hypothetical protein AUK35_09100 [Zetaproteobacteria bacterium CG2_30_46_52]
MIVLGGRLAIACIGLIAIRAVTTFLSPEEYGYLALLLMVQTLCGMFLVNPVGVYINRHTHQWWGEGTLMSRLKPFRFYVIAVSLVGGIVMFGVALASANEHPFLSAFALMLMVVFGTWNATWVPRLNVLGFRLDAVFWGVLTVALSLLFSVALMLLGTTATVWFWGQVLGMLVGAAGAGKLMRKYAKTLGHTEVAPAIDFADLMRFSLPLAIGTGFMWLQLSGYRLVVEAYWGLSQLGYITVGLLLATQIWSVFESLAMQFLYPYFFKSISDNHLESGERALSDLINVLGPFYLVLAGLTVVAAPLLVHLLVDSKFSDAVPFVMMGAFIECCRALANVFGNAAQVTKKTLSLALPYGFGAFVVFSFLFATGLFEAGVIWVGAALIAGALGMLVVMVFSMYKQVRFKFKRKSWLIGMFGMILFCVMGFWYGELNTAPERFGLVVFVVLASGLLTFALLRRNAALTRLLDTQLSGENGV